MGKQEVKVTLFGDDKILYIENPEQAIRKLLILINAFGSYRIKKKLTQRKLLHSYTQTTKDREENSRKQYHLPLHQK